MLDIEMGQFDMSISLYNNDSIVGVWQFFFSAASHDSVTGAIQVW